jgi:hypothetical protein
MVMSTPSPPRPSADLQPTRQQLDDLDALLRRMLDLPVNSTTTTVEAPVPQPLVPPSEEGHPIRESSAPAPPVSYVVVETTSKDAPEPETATPAAPTSAAAPVEGEGWIPFRSSWQPSPQTWGPLADSWHQARAGRPSSSPAEPTPDAPAPTPAPAADMTPAPPSPVAVPTPAAPPPRLPPLDLTWRPAWQETLLAPLVWFNRAFDGCLMPLGRLGRVLCGSPGRTVLGFVGLACLAAAVTRALTGGILPWTR